MTRALSGHPGDQKLPALPRVFSDPTNGELSAQTTSPHGTGRGESAYKNLTPDVETGLGSWTEDMFKNALRTGKHMGAPDGRNILPPMPWPMYKSFTDADIHASGLICGIMKPIKNAVSRADPVQSRRRQSRSRCGAGELWLALCLLAFPCWFCDVSCGRNFRHSIDGCV